MGVQFKIQGSIQRFCRLLWLVAFY